MTDREILDGLSPAMRRCLLRAWTDREGVLRVEQSLCPSSTRKALERRGIVTVGSYATTALGARLFELVSAEAS